ncbi:MAG: SCO family protein [Burkholderiaceae bacterium]|nr:SCO family protein [Burkholderiaceae bacterium]
MIRRRAAVAAIAACCASNDRRVSAAQFEPGRGLVGLPKQDFRPPAAGSYRLPVIAHSPDGWVLEGNHTPRRLSAYTRGAVTLVSFVYTYCTDPIGCPLAYAAMLDVIERVRKEPVLRDRARLVSLSFDPTNDTPEAMKAYGGEHAVARAPRWHFLTTASMRQLSPILQGFGQDAEIEHDDADQPTRVITHVLKVFLLDARGRVREIYSAAFLMPEVIVNDMLTLALEPAGAAP